MVADERRVAGGLDGGGAGQLDRGGQGIAAGDGTGSVRGLGHPAIVPDASSRRRRAARTARCGTMDGCPPPAVRPVRAGASGRPAAGPADPDRVDTTPLAVAAPATRPMSSAGAGARRHAPPPAAGPARS